MIITGKEKGKTLEQGGGIVMTSHIWLGPGIPALKEVTDFDQRYAKAMGEIFGSAEFRPANGHGSRHVSGNEGHDREDAGAEHQHGGCADSHRNGH